MITAQIEPLSDVLDEMKPLFPAHWEELAIYREKMPLDPQYGEYLRRDAEGSVLLTTLREAGALIGYLVCFIAPGMHYQSTLTCTMDILYIHPERRGQKAARMILDTTRAELKRRGVKLWWMGSKNHKPIEGLFEAYGFDRSETYFSLWVGDDA